MKKVFFIVLWLLFASEVFSQPAAPENPSTDVDPVIKKQYEIGLNVISVIVGTYQVHFETAALVPDGLVSTGVKATVTNQQNVFGSAWDLIGFQGLVDCRLYPALYRRGPYIQVEGGYSQAIARDGSRQIAIRSFPYLAGLGWKWLVGEFSVDLGLAYGSMFYWNPPAADGLDFDAFPLNVAADGYLLAGYRF